MNITITARKTSVRDSFKDRIERKLGKLDRFFDDGANASGFRQVIRSFPMHSF